MTLERTLAIIKPDGVARNLIGKCLARFEAGGLTIIATKLLKLDQAQAQDFYAVHRERPFFNSLVDYMISGPVVVAVLQGENAIAKHREILGATDPAQATAGTIRKDFGESVERNTCHGSDGPETAAFEISYFFTAGEICPR